MPDQSERKMPRKKTEPPSKPVRIQEDVYDGLAVLSSIFKKSMPQFASEILKPIIEAGLAAHGLEFPIVSKDKEMADIVKQVAAKFKVAKG